MQDGRRAWREQVVAGRAAVRADFTMPPDVTGWVVVGRPSDVAGRRSLAPTLTALTGTSLATMVLHLPAADVGTRAGWAHLGADQLRPHAGGLPIAWFGAGEEAAPGWLAAAGGAFDAVMTWNARLGPAWACLPAVTVPSLFVVDGDDPLVALVARAARWRLAGGADLVTGAAAGDAGVLAAWFGDRLLRPPAPVAAPQISPARRRMASVGVAAALAAAPAATFAATVAAQPAAAATAGLPDFSAGARLSAAQIGGDNAAHAAVAAPAARHRLGAADIGGDGKVRGPMGDPPLVDGIGARWNLNTNVGFATSSSASGAASEGGWPPGNPVMASTLNGGTINQTLGDAFDGYNALCLDVNNVGGQCNTANMSVYNQNGPASLECSNRQVVLPPKTMGNFTVSRKVFVPTNDGFARWLDIVKNNSATPQAVRLQTSNNLGSDSGTRIVTTSDGDATPEITDTWVTTFQNFSGTTSSDARIGHVLQGANPPVGLSAMSFVNGDDNPFWRYEFTLAPGQTGIIMNFATLQPTKAAAATKSAELASLTNANALNCMTATEKSEVRNFSLLAAPTLSSQASVGGPVGTTLTDTATVAGGASPTGTVTFRLFTDASCMSQVFTSTNALVGSAATSSGFTPSGPGTYYWTATYNGDANNATAVAGCGAANESATITLAAPTLSSQASAGGPVGTVLTDTATIAGGASPTGTVTFKLFTDSSCSSQVFASTNALVGASATSSGFTPATTGTYYWTATYNGDANNATAVAGCGAPNESATITAAVPPPCTTSLTGDVSGPLTVMSGQTYCLNSARVTGPVTVQPGGALTVTGSRITNGIVADAPKYLSVCGSQVTAPTANPAQGIVVRNTTVAPVVGDPAAGCAGNRVAGDVTFTGNVAGLTFGANVVSRNVTVNSNAGPTVVKANTTYGTLACSANNPPPTNAGQPNTSTTETGQCAGL